MTKKVNAFSQRNAAIDILRALTMLLMIFVNDLWSIKGYPAWLGHASSGQDMLGLADVVFPCFLFVVGMSIPYAIEARYSRGYKTMNTIGHILTRTLALLLMGVFIVNTEYGVSAATGMSYGLYRVLMVAAFFLIWNIYPRTENKNRQHFYTALKVVGWLLLLYLAIVFRDRDGGIFAARWWGILGIIGWTYLVCAFVYMFTRDNLKYIIPVWLVFILIGILKSPLIGGDAILSLPRGNFLDTALGILHIGNGSSVAFTMGGVLLTLISVKYSEAENKKKISFAVIASVGLLLLGFITNKFWIVSKLSATPPWVFYCTGIAVAAYSFIYWLDKIDKTAVFKIIGPAGTATLTCYLVPYILYAIPFFTLPTWATTGVGGIIKCILFAFFTIGVTYVLGRFFKIKLKI